MTLVILERRPAVAAAMTDHARTRPAAARPANGPIMSPLVSAPGPHAPQSAGR